MRAGKLSAVRNESVTCLPPLIDPAHEHYPFCVVWTPIPLLTWVLPFVGHIGICDSRGHIFDFQGNYSIGEDHMLFGNPTRYWDVSKLFAPTFYNHPVTGDEAEEDAHSQSVQREIQAYDDAIYSIIRHFRRNESYNFFTNNCHAFVAACLNAQPLAKRKDNTFTLCFRAAFNGRYVTAGRCAKTLLPFIVLTLLVVLAVSILL